MSPAQVALNEPLALVGNCSVTFHLKSVHALGDGMILDDDQLPSRALTPVAVGPSELLRSNPMHPAADAAVTEKAITTAASFMAIHSCEPASVASFSCRRSAGRRPAA
jgi:hypothetical protein